MKKLFFIFAFAFVVDGAMAQFSSDPTQNLQLVQDHVYNNYETAVLPDGSWYMFTDRPVKLDSATPFLQYFSEDGELIWEREVTKQLTKTYTVANDYLLMDKDNNAIVAAHDLRRSLQGASQNSYTVYKFNTEGENLWAREGVSLHGELLPDFTAALKMIQLSDGSYVFAWQETMMSADNPTIRLQRVSADGQPLWGNGKTVSMENTNIEYPYLVDAGNLEFILAYAQGASQEIYARKMDFDGNDVWAKPTLVYSGSLPSTPLWTWMTAIPADGGILMSWPGGGDPEKPLMAWVKGDGTHAFQDAEQGLRMGYNDDYRTAGPKIVFDKANSAIYALWREFDPNTQSWQRMAAQKISFDGELLWDPMGVDIAPLKSRSVSYYSIQLGPKGSVMSAWMENQGMEGVNVIDAKAVLLSSEGSYAWADTTVVIATNTEEMIREKCANKADMVSTPMVGDQWIFVWSDNRDFGNLDNSGVYGQNLHADGTLGGSVGNEKVYQQAMAVLQTYPNPVTNTALIRFGNPDQAVDVRIDLLDLGGAVVAPVYNGRMEAGANTIEWSRPAGLASGMYLLRAVSGKNVSYGKTVLK